jgi:deoxyadenosine/deoxycytidine kinase
MLKIGFCGAHGTGKTTLARITAEKFNLRMLERTMRDMWEKFGISDFEKLPGDVRKTFQYYAVLTQIEREEQADIGGFVTDRTVLDNLGYTVLSAEVTETEKKIYEALVKERLKNYTHLIYVPVEFKAEYEFLRADPGSQKSLEEILEGYLQQFFPKNNYLRVTGSIDERTEKISQYINKQATV